MANGYFLEIVNGSPVRVKAFTVSDNVVPEYKAPPADQSQALLQESKRLNDIMKAARLAAPI